MRFIVYGAGAIGGLLGGLLAEAGHDVLLVARGPHAEAIRTSGLTIEMPEDKRVVAVPVVTGPEAITFADGDVVLLAMKSQDTAAALAALRRAAPPGTPVVCVQNGVDNEVAALRLFDRVYGVCVMCPAGHLEPGVVVGYAAPIPGLLDIGRFPSGTDETSAAVAAAFRSAGFESQDLGDIMRWKYRKLLMNLGNAVEAVFHGPDRSQLRSLARAEGEAALAAAGIAVASAEEDAARRGDRLQIRPVAGQPRGGGSTWQSLRRATGSIESDFLNGEICLLGRRFGVSTPVNALLQTMAWDAAFGAVPPGSLPTSALLDRLTPGTAGAA